MLNGNTVLTQMNERNGCNGYTQTPDISEHLEDSSCGEHGRRSSLCSESGGSDLKDSTHDLSTISDRPRRGSLSRSSLSGSASSGLNLMGMGGTMKRESTLEALEKKRRKNISDRLKDIQSTLSKKEATGTAPSDLPAVVETTPPSPSNLPVIVGMRSRPIPRLQSTRTRQKQQLTQRCNSYDQVKAIAFNGRSSSLGLPPDDDNSNSSQGGRGYGRSESVDPGSFSDQLQEHNELKQKPTAAEDFVSTPPPIRSMAPPSSEFTDHPLNRNHYDLSAEELASVDEENAQNGRHCLQTKSNQSGANGRDSLGELGYKTANDLKDTKAVSQLSHHETVRFDPGVNESRNSARFGNVDSIQTDEKQHNTFISNNKYSPWDQTNNIIINSLPNESSSTENVTRWLKHQAEAPTLSQYTQHNMQSNASNVNRNMLNNREGGSLNQLRSYAELADANQVNSLACDHIAVERRLNQSSKAEFLSDDNDCNPSPSVKQAVNQNIQNNDNFVNNALTNEKLNKNLYDRDDRKASADEYHAGKTYSDKLSPSANETNLLRPPIYSGSRFANTRNLHEYNSLPNNELNSANEERSSFTKGNSSFSRGISVSSDTRSVHSSRSPSPGSIRAGMQCRGAQELMRTYGHSANNNGTDLEYQAKPRASTTIHTSRLDFTPSRCRRTRDLREMSPSPSPSSQRSPSIDRMLSLDEPLRSLSNQSKLYDNQEPFSELSSLKQSKISTDSGYQWVDRVHGLGQHSRLNQSTLSANVGSEHNQDIFRRSPQPNALKSSDNSGNHFSASNLMHQKSQSEILTTKTADSNRSKFDSTLPRSASKDVQPSRMASDYDVYENRMAPNYEGSQVQIQDRGVNGDNWSKDIRTRLEEIRRRANMTENNNGNNVINSRSLNSRDDTHLSGANSRRELVNRLGRERDRRSNSVSSCVSGELKLVNGNESYNINKKEISVHSSNGTHDSVTSSGAERLKSSANSEKHSEKPDLDSVRAKMFNIISTIPTYGSSQVRVPVRTLASRQNPKEEGTPVRVEGQIKPVLEGTPVRVEVIKSSSDKVTNSSYITTNQTTTTNTTSSSYNTNHQVANSLPRTSNPTERLPSVDRTWETYPKSPETSIHQINIPSLDATSHKPQSQNKDTYNSYKETQHFLGDDKYHGTESEVANAEVMEVTIQKSGLGLGFCIEGGKNSAGGDRPITVKRLFHAGYRASPVDSGALRPHVGRGLPDGGALRPGDELVAAEGYQLSELTHYSAWNFLKTLPDGPVRLLIRRKIN